jgi:hypothetical protein
LSTTPKIDKSEQRDPAYQTRQLSGLAIQLSHRIGLTVQKVIELHKARSRDSVMCQVDGQSDSCVAK